MKEENINKEEIRELEEMARIGKDFFPGDLSKIEQTLNNRVDAIVPPVKDVTLPQQSMNWGILLLLLVAIAFAAFFLLKSGDNTSPPIQYAMAYYEAPPFVISQGNRGEGETYTELSAVNDAYKRKDYTKILTLTENHKLDDLGFYRGIALLELGRVDEAIALFEQQSDDELKDMRTWYLALGYLRANKKQSATSELEKIVNTPSHYKRNQAAELIEKIGTHIN